MKNIIYIFIFFSSFSVGQSIKQTTHEIEIGANYYEKYFYFDNDQLAKITTTGHHADSLIIGKQEIKLELNEIIQTIDSLKYVREMPYMCQDDIDVKKRHPSTIGCGDEKFWNAVRLNKNGIELLIDKLDDTTTTSAPVPLFGYNYTVADIAYTALKEIIHHLPTFDLLGVPFDEEECGDCSYWQHLNSSYSNRQKFKEAVKHWYHKNKDHLIWIESNAFATCDCGGQHPNRGHYELNR